MGFLFPQKEVRRRWKEDFLLVVTRFYCFFLYTTFSFGVINFNLSFFFFFCILGLMVMTSRGTDYIRK